MKKNKLPQFDRHIMIAVFKRLAIIDYKKYHESKLTKKKFIVIWTDSMHTELDFYGVDKLDLKREFLKNYESR